MRSSHSTVTWIDLYLFCENQSPLFSSAWKIFLWIILTFNVFFIVIIIIIIIFILFSFISKEIKVTNKKVAITSIEVDRFARTQKYWQGKFDFSIILGAYLNTSSDSGVTQVTSSILMALLYSSSNMTSGQVFENHFLNVINTVTWSFHKFSNSN